MAAFSDSNEVHRKPGSPMPQVGVAVLLCRGERVLVCRNKSKTHYDEFALPGGFLEFGETLEECACREMQEATGMDIMNVHFGTATNTILLDKFKPVQYVTLYMRASPVDPEQEPETLEPDKCDGFRWVLWPNVPGPIFKPLQELLEMNYDPFL